MKKLLLLFCLVVIEIISFGQTITLGTGTSTNGITEASPVNIYYRRQVSQTVYTATELNAAGVTGPATINQIGFFVTNIPIYNIPGYTIQMKHTTAVNAGGNLNGGYTTVKNAFTYSPTQGNWDMIALDNPFLWDGIQNIAIRICWSQVQPNYDPSGQLRIYNATNGYQYRRYDNGGSICNQNPNTVINVKPQLRVVFESETVWTGATNTDWFTASNWTANVPDATMDARIPVGTPNNPNLTGTANCLNLILEGSMTLSTSGVLNINGNFTNTGTYTDLGGQTILTGVGPNTVNNSGSLTFSNLIFESDNGGVITGSNIIVSQELQVNKTTLNTNGLITIRSDASGTGRIAELITNCFYTLNMQDSWGDGWNGGTLTIFEDGINIGTYQAYGASTSVILSLGNGSNIELSYSAGNFENENTYQLVDPNGVTVFSDGTNPATGIVFTTTPACGFTPPITGAITMERYIDAGQTYWRFFSSAVQGATIGDYEGDFVTAGYAGSAFPNFGWVSIYTYDETLGAGLGYLEVTNTNQVIQVGEGLNVWSGDTITGTLPFLVDLTGVPNQGDINMPVSFTNTGTASEDGWCIIGNPYASTIDWDSPNWTKTNMANATYILNPDSQQYATYVNGASTNGGSRFIASQQAFWVYATAASPQLIAREGVKSANDVAFFKSSSISPGMMISLNGFGMTDECVMRHVDNTLDEYEAEYDAYKLYGGWGVYPNISLINTTNQDLSIHSFDKQFQEWEIPVKVIVFQNGMYDITFSQMSELDVPCLKLEDTYTGQMYDVLEGQAINVELSDTTTLPRFILHIGRNYESLATAVICNGESNGSISVDLEDVNIVDYQLTFNNQTVLGNATANPLLIENLQAGTYVLEVPSLTNLCGTTNFTITVPSPTPLNIANQVQDEMIGNDGSVQVNVGGGTAPYSYVWSNGDTTSQINYLTEGNYSVTITDANACVITDQFYVGTSLSVDKNIQNNVSFSLSYSEAQNQLTINNLNLTENTLVHIYNINGDLVEVYKVQVNTKTSVHKLKKALAKGVYVVKVNTESLKFVY